MEQHVLSILIFLPIVAALGLMAMPTKDPRAIRIAALTASLFNAVFALSLAGTFVAGVGGPQFEVNADWLPSLGIRYHLGVDGLSLVLVLITTLLTPFAIFASFGLIKEKVRGYYAWLLLLSAGMVGAVVSLNVFLFYVFFELMLIPAFFLIGIWGGPNRVKATVKFVVYTIVGSLLMFVAILFLAYTHFAQAGSWSFEVQDLVTTALTGRRDGQDRGLRLSALRPAPLPGGGAPCPALAHDPRPHRDHLRGLGRPRAERHQAAPGLQLDLAHGRHHARRVRARPAGLDGRRLHVHGPCPRHRRPVPDVRDARDPQGDGDFRLRRHREGHALVHDGLPHPGPGLDRVARVERVHRRVPDPALGEAIVLVPIAIAIIGTGFFPQPLLKRIDPSVEVSLGALQKAAGMPVTTVEAAVPTGAVGGNPQ